MRTNAESHISLQTIEDEIVLPNSGHKWRNLALLSASALFAVTLWFSASVVAPQLADSWSLNSTQRSWITMSVQLGFVIGALISAILNLADRIPGQKLVGICAFAGAAFNAAIPIFEPGFSIVLILRFLTGASLAGVYPTGMKLVATWCRHDRGLGIGILVGALTVGSAAPHLIAALSLNGSILPWKTVMLVTSGLAVIAGILVTWTFKPGPYLGGTAPFNWRFIGQAFSQRPTRLANFGYLGHMWELYAMWTWVPLFIMESYRAAGWSPVAGRLAGFGAVAVGAAGCVLAGKLADSLGRTSVTIASLIISSFCALIAGQLFSSPAILTIACLVWGFAVVADSAQFSAAISELTDPRYVGTALTLQTSLGFLLTLFTIQLTPELVRLVGWDYALMALAIGPILGIWSMLRLRGLPEAFAMARGKR
jgi:MFS family permease